LAGENDIGTAGITDGREINRHNYTLGEIDKEIQRPVVRGLIKLIKFRNSCPAFDGIFELYGCSDHEISLGWNSLNSFARLNIDLLKNSFEIKFNDGLSEGEQILDLE
jgi:sucrose phosphorylase